MRLSTKNSANSSNKVLINFVFSPQYHLQKMLHRQESSWERNREEHTFRSKMQYGLQNVRNYGFTEFIYSKIQNKFNGKHATHQKVNVIEVFIINTMLHMTSTQYQKHVSQHHSMSHSIITLHNISVACLITQSSSTSTACKIFIPTFLLSYSKKLYLAHLKQLCKVFFLFSSNICFNELTFHQLLQLLLS